MDKKISKKLLSMLMVGFLILSGTTMAAAQDTSEDDLSVTILEPESGDEVTIDTMVNSLSTEYDIENSNDENETTVDVEIDVNDSSGNSESFDVQTDEEIDEDTVENFEESLTVSDLKAGDEWTIEVTADSDDDYSVSDSVTFDTEKEDSQGMIIELITVALFITVAFGVVNKF